MTELTPEPKAKSNRMRVNISLDWWAVITALVLALLVVLGVITTVPW